MGLKTDYHIDVRLHGFEVILEKNLLPAHLQNYFEGTWIGKME